MLLDDGKALVELSGAILITHECLELGELARCDVNHLVFADIASHTGVLTLVVNGSTSGLSSGGSLV